MHRVFLVVIGTRNNNGPNMFPYNLYQACFKRLQPDVVVASTSWKEHVNMIRQAVVANPSQAVFIVESTGRAAKNLSGIAHVVHQLPYSSLLGLHVSELPVEGTSFIKFDHMVHMQSRAGAVALGAALYAAAEEFTTPGPHPPHPLPDSVITAALHHDVSTTVRAWHDVAAHAGSCRMQAGAVAFKDATNDWKRPLLRLLQQHHIRAEEKATRAFLLPVCDSIQCVVQCSRWRHLADTFFHPWMLHCSCLRYGLYRVH